MEKEKIKINDSEKYIFECSLAGTIRPSFLAYDSLYQCINLLRGFLNKESPTNDIEIMEKHFGKEKTIEILKRLDETRVLLAIVNSYYMGLRESTIKKSDIKDYRFIEFQKALSRIPLIDLDLFSVFSLLLNHTTLCDSWIKSDISKKVQQMDIRVMKQDDSDKEDEDLDLEEE